MLMTTPRPGSGAPDRGALRTLTSRRNMLLLTQLRWLAIAGQLGAILYAWAIVQVPLPIVPMILILVALAALNVATLGALQRWRTVSNRHLFAALLADWIALTAQLYLSGGATNPFASIGLLQIVLGAVLLDAWSSWTIVVLHSGAFGLLMLAHRPLLLPPPYASTIAPAHIFASWLNFQLVAVLLVLFITRIGRNLRQRDRSLAEMRQREAEEDHIVRMGLLASGAAHELGTPLASLSVILGDWRAQPAIAADSAMREEVEEMRAAVARCKDIVGGILYASGDPRGEGVERMPLRLFVDRIGEDWARLHPDMLTIEADLPHETVIAADRALGHIVSNLLDNAAEAGAGRILMRVAVSDGLLRLTVADDGPGFEPAMLERIGQPYASTRGRRGAGLGLFLAVNVLRKLGGRLTARNGEGGGAIVTLALPLDALTVEELA